MRPGFDFLLHLMGQFPQSPHSLAHSILLDATICLRTSKQLGMGGMNQKTSVLRGGHYMRLTSSALRLTSY